MVEKILETVGIILMVLFAFVILLSVVFGVNILGLISFFDAIENGVYIDNITVVSFVLMFDGAIIYGISQLLKFFRGK